MKTLDTYVASCGTALRSRIIFAMEFDWQNEWPGGASESIVVCVILNLRLQFSLRPVVSRGKTLVPFCRSSELSSLVAAAIAAAAAA